MLTKQAALFVFRSEFFGNPDLGRSSIFAYSPLRHGLGNYNGRNNFRLGQLRHGIERKGRNRSHHGRGQGEPGLNPAGPRFCTRLAASRCWRT